MGSIQGRLKKAFEKITKLHAKQDFSIALVVGDVFGSGPDADTELEELVNGSISVPLPTYFSVGDEPFPARMIQILESSDEVCRNLIFLGRKGTFTTSDGVRIVTLGGRLLQSDQPATQPLGKFDPFFIEPDAKALTGAHSAQILLTNQWPANIARLSGIEVPDGIDKESGAQAIANLALGLKPWYHFSSTPAAVWEREPYKQPDEYGSLQEPAITRFKSAASVSAPNKEWMTAFSIDTSKPPPAQQSTDAPFVRGSPPRKRAYDGDGEYSRYTDRYNDGQGDRRRNKRPRNMDPSECFMCLNQPGFKTHMVVSIGDESLLSILRGPLPLPNTFPDLSFSGHTMIIPHYHAADELAQGRRSPEEVAAEFAEMSKFRRALSTMVGAKSHGKLGTVCWEVNRTGIRHFHWQLIAAQAEQIRKGLVEAAFKVLGEKRKHQSFQDFDPEKQLEQRSDYFRVWTWAPSANPVEQADDQVNEGESTGVTKSMFFPLPATEQGFHIWYGREVMAGILQLENRINWKAALHPDETQELKMKSKMQLP